VEVLQVLWDGGGNVPPQLAIARGLVERGHRVRILGHRCQRNRAEATGASFRAYRHAPDADASRPETDLIRDWEARTPLGAFANARDRLIFGPSLLFARDVIEALEEAPADVVAWDFFLMGAGIGAESAGVPSAALIHTVYPLPTDGVPPFGQGLMPARGRPGRFRDAVLRRLFERTFRPGLDAANRARAELGLDRLESPWGQVERVERALILTSPAFDFAGAAQLPDNVRYAGPVLDAGGAGSWDSPWDADDDRPLVLASFSTTYMDQGDLAGRTVEALAELPVRGLLTTGPAIDAAAISAPANVEVREFVPHAAVLPDAGLVITHAGLGTVHAALAAGVPLVCIPDGRDQDDNAARVVFGGAGVRAKRRVGPGKLQSVVAAALADASLKQGAARMAEDFAGRDGAAFAAAELESLAGGSD
jgi:MGT family glycosyltransferase